MNEFDELDCDIFRENIYSLSKEFKNKKVLLYGAGIFFDEIIKNYDFKKMFNVIGISDLKFEDSNVEFYQDFKVIKPSNITKNNFDVILLTTLRVSQGLLDGLSHIDKQKVHIYPDCNKLAQYLQKKYEKNLIRIKNKKDKIRVGFLVSQVEKWQYGTLYDILKNDERFEPIVYVSLLDWCLKYNTDEENEKCLDDMYNFFKSKNINVEYAIKGKKYININDFELDLIFYQQPWGISLNQNIAMASNRSLTFYCPYAICEADYIFPMSEGFFKLLYKHFLAAPCAKEQYLNYAPELKNLEVTGHPKLDMILETFENNQKIKDKKTIIYAPHHSLHEDSLLWSTFDKYKDFMLELAKQHLEFNWVIKPHPWLKERVISTKLMSEKEYDDYLSQWAKIGKVKEGGDYFIDFLNSDLMITDCGSFIVEYFLTKNPVIHLVSENPKAHSSLNQQILKTYYKAYNKKELEKHFSDIMLKNLDPMREKRLDLLKELNFGSAAQNIFKTLKDSVLDSIKV